MSRVRLFSTPAIVMRRADYGEADRLLTLLTPERGKMRVLAKGARKITSRKAGHIELFTETQVLLAKGRTFDIVTQAELIESHRALREDVSRGGQAHYFCELAEQFAPEDSDASALYDLLADGLAWLGQSHDALLTARFFEMRLLSLEGYRPDLFKCSRTGETLEIDRDPAVERAAFSPQQGGTLMSAAAMLARDAFFINRSTLMLLRALQTRPFEEINALAVTRDIHDQIERAMQAYVSYVIERKPRSPALIRQMEMR